MIVKPTVTLPWGGTTCCCTPYGGVDVPCCSGVVLPNILHLTCSVMDSTPSSNIPTTFPLTFLNSNPTNYFGPGWWSPIFSMGPPLSPFPCCYTQFILWCQTFGAVDVPKFRLSAYSGVGAPFCSGLYGNQPDSTDTVISLICSPFIATFGSVILGVGECDVGASFGNITNITITK